MPEANAIDPLYYIRHHLRVVLVEPAGGLNVGSIARVMKNMGLYQLVLVNPHCEVLGDDARKMAVHGVDVLENAAIVATVPDALQGCRRVVSTSARDRDLAIPVDAPRLGLQWLLEPMWVGRRGEAIAPSSHPEQSSNASPVDSAMVFGPEDRGLSNAELIHAQRLITIPSNPDYESLNLAQAVAICCYEVYQLVLQGLQTGPSSENSPPGLATTPPQSSSQQDATAIAPVDMVEGYYQQLETVLLKIGYLYPHTAKRRMEKFRLLFNRTGLTQNEVAMLRGILRQVEWASVNAMEQPDQQENPGAEI